MYITFQCIWTIFCFHSITAFIFENKMATIFFRPGDFSEPGGGHLVKTSWSNYIFSETINKAKQISCNRYEENCMEFYKTLILSRVYGKQRSKRKITVGWVFFLMINIVIYKYFGNKWLKLPNFIMLQNVLGIRSFHSNKNIMVIWSVFCQGLSSMRVT